MIRSTMVRLVILTLVADGDQREDHEPDHRRADHLVATDLLARGDDPVQPELGHEVVHQAEQNADGDAEPERPLAELTDDPEGRDDEAESDVRDLLLVADDAEQALRLHGGFGVPLSGLALELGHGGHLLPTQRRTDADPETGRAGEDADEHADEG